MKLVGGGLIWDNLANAQLQNALLSIAGCQLEVVIPRPFIWQLEGNGKNLKLTGSPNKSLMCISYNSDKIWVG